VPCKSCGTGKRERLDFLADTPFSPKRFAHDGGKRCRAPTRKEIAEELPLDWDTGKALEKQYRAAQVAKRGTPGPKGSGSDERAIRKGHPYRIVVSDLIRRQAIWFGGEDRSEASMAQFSGWLGKRKAAGVRLAVMDMWKPFRNATTTYAPQAAILFDKVPSGGIWAKPSTRDARPSTGGSAAKTGAPARGRSTPCSRIGRISQAKLGKA
jgi:transposase